MSHLLPILVVLIGLVTLFFADKRAIASVSKQ